MNRILFVVALLALVLSACGTSAVPTIDPAQVQASAVAAASTMVAATHAAIPTNTAVPPTSLPSPTALLLPTLSQLATLPAFPTLTLPAPGDSADCKHLLDVGAAGAPAPVLIRNDTKGPVTFSMGLGSKNSFGQCGYLAWANIPKANSIMVSVPQTRTNQGDPCYWAYAFVNDPKRQVSVSGGGFCINNPDKWTFDVTYDRIKLTPP